MVNELAAQLNEIGERLTAAGVHEDSYPECISILAAQRDAAIARAERAEAAARIQGQRAAALGSRLEAIARHGAREALRRAGIDRSERATVWVDGAVMECRSLVEAGAHDDAIAAATARAEKAEAERDEALKLAHVSHAGGVYTHQKAVDLLKEKNAAIDSERARADRYLALIRELADDRSFVRGDWDANTCGLRITMDLWKAIRAAAKEEK